MRVSTNTMYELGVATIQRQQADLLKVQQQVATNRRILTPSDDPAAAARSLDITQAMEVTKQYKKNADASRSALQMEESALNSIESVILEVKTLAVQSGNAALSAGNRAQIALDVRNKYNELFGVANMKDGNNQYLFSGFKGATQPFTQTSGAGVFVGDQGQRKVQISASRQVETNDSGAMVFKPGVTGQDIFSTIDTLANALNSSSFAASDVTTALSQLDTELNNVLKVHASVGARLKEIDSTQNSSMDVILQHEETLSGLQDIDLASAISDLTKKQYYLQAAQQSFIKVTNLSLFNYI